MMDKLKMAADIKKRADAMNLELSTSEIKAVDPTGLAQVTVSGLAAPLRVIVSPELAKKVCEKEFLLFDFLVFDFFLISYYLILSIHILFWLILFYSPPVKFL